MTIVRTVQGLVELDQFSSDSRGNYDALTGPIGWSSGYITLPSGDTMQRADFTTATCITARVLNSGDYFSGPWLGKIHPLSAAGDADGYCVYGVPSNWGTRKVTDNAVTTLGSTTSGFPSAGSYGIGRIYIANGVQFRVGTTSLANVPSGGGNTDYSPPFYYGIRSPLAANLQTDWLEARTSHLVIMTGLPTGWWLRTTNSEGTNDAQESGGTATVDLSARLFGPNNFLTRVGVWNGNPASGGVEQEFITNTVYSDMGGGDIYVWYPATRGRPSPMSSRNPARACLPRHYQ